MAEHDDHPAPRADAHDPPGDDLSTVFTEHHEGEASAFSDEIPHHVRTGPRDSGDDWAYGPDGSRAWGRFGAAGLLAIDRTRGVLLQHRARWSHFGGTWGIPGGALREGELAVDAAVREAGEEADVPADALEPLFTRVVDLGYWRYTTLAAVTNRRVRVRITDAESAGLAWVKPAELTRLDLHPGFGRAWPELERLMHRRPLLVIDAANVVGSRPDGWWKDRAGAAGRLIDELAVLARDGVPGALVDPEAERFWPDVLVVLEGKARSAAPVGEADGRPRLVVSHAAGSGDDAIVEAVRAAREADPERTVLVATSDRGLRERVTALGATIIASGAVRRLLDDAAPGGDAPSDGEHEGGAVS